MEQFIWLIPLGLMVGAFGTLIGAGGGFILVPVLLLLYPDKSPETITSISLAVVFINALSGSFAYAKMKRIDYKSGIIFAVSTIPGSVFGAYSVSLIPGNIFKGIFGILLISISIFLLFKPNNEKNHVEEQPKNHLIRFLTDAEGTSYTFSYNPVSGVIISIFVGYFSSLFGVGGGIIHVPVMVHALSFPVHIATATSQFVLAITSLSGSAVHAVSGILGKGIIQTTALSIGVLFGAQIGARLSHRFQGTWIIRFLAVALAIVGVRIITMAFR